MGKTKDKVQTNIIIIITITIIYIKTVQRKKDLPFKKAIINILKR